MLKGSDIYTKLQSLSAVTDLIDARVYPQYNDEADKAFPLIVYKLEGVHSSPTFSGPPTGVQYADITFAVVDPTKSDAEEVAEVIQTALDGDASTWGTTTVLDCSLKEDGIGDDVITNEATEDIMYYVKEIVFELVYR